MSRSLQLSLCDTQGQLFELSSKYGYNSEAFIKAYMTSKVSMDMDKEFNHLQWAGKAYILSRIEDELSDKLIKDADVFDKETLYWIGYIYRYWHFYTGEKSKEIYKQASAKTMKTVYRLKETYIKKKIK